MTFLDFALIGLAALYLSEVITGKSGPGDIFKRLRELDRTGLLSCVWCIAPWIAIIMLAIYYLWYPPVVWVFAVAGLAMALRAYTGINHGN